MAILILDSTTKSIKAVMSGAAATTNPDFTAAWADNNGTTFVEGASDGALSGTSSATLVAAPASSTRRVIKSITIENKDTAPVTVTISYDNNGTLRVIAKVTLQVGDTWTTDGTFDTTGSLKQAVGNVNLATQVTGTLPIANGGTGATTLAGANIAVFNASNTFTAAQTFRAASAIRSEAASTQDAIVIAGRAGGTNSYAVTLTPTTLSASRTMTLPDANTTIPVFSQVITFSGPTAARTVTLPDENFSVGFRNIPRSGSAKTTSYTLATGDIGEFIEVGSGGSVTIPDATFATGDVVSIFNNTSGNITITCTITTAYIAGTDADKATVSLATRGVATILFLSGTVCVISGNVS